MTSFDLNNGKMNFINSKFSNKRSVYRSSDDINDYQTTPQNTNNTHADACFGCRK